MKLFRVTFLSGSIVVLVALAPNVASAAELDQLVSSSGRTIDPASTSSQVSPSFKGSLPPKDTRVLTGRTLIGADNRIRVTDTTTYPERAVALIENQGVFCTGFLVSPDTIVAAGLCLHKGKGGEFRKVSSFRIVPGAKGDKRPFGLCRAKEFFVPKGWALRSLEEYEYGLIKLRCDVGEEIGWFGFYWTGSSLESTRVKMNSYPGDKPYGTQWTMTSPIRHEAGRLLFYAFDTSGGSGGAPLYLRHSPDCSVCALAIHGQGQHGNSGPHHDYNHGARITRRVFNNIKAVIDLD